MCRGGGSVGARSSGEWRGTRDEGRGTRDEGRGTRDEQEIVRQLVDTQYTIIHHVLASMYSRMHIIL